MPYTTFDYISAHIRDYLTAQYSGLDPANTTPAGRDHVLRTIENEYSQSVEDGNADQRLTGLASAEQMLLWLLAQAEAEWDRLGRASLVSTKTSHLLRRLAATLVKRAVGTALGHHANEELLDDYAGSLRDRPRLNRLTGGLQSLLGTANFQFDMVESFGQPRSERSVLLRLVGPQAGIRAEPAPSPTETSPAHDVPCLEITSTEYRIPITFDLFLALKLRQRGCASSSLPASVRASIDRVRHRYAGNLCRAKDKFLDQTATIEIADKARILLADPAQPLTIEPL